MTAEGWLTRDAIIQALVNDLEPLDYIFAFWEGGAVAFNRVDQWSDIDLYLVVDDKKVDETFLAVERTLKSLSSIKQKYEVADPPAEGLFQAFYRLDDASEYLVVDLAVLKLSSPDKFLEPEIHGDVKFYFNKTDKLKPSPYDRDKLVKKLKTRLLELQSNFDMFSNLVQKEINRGNHLEAIDLYYRLTIATLVETLRIRHNPIHHDFRMRYVHHELPSTAVERLKHLCFIRNEKDLQVKYLKATAWFKETMLKIRNQK